MKKVKTKKMTLEDFAKFFQEEAARFIARMDKSFSLYEAKQNARALARSFK